MADVKNKTKEIDLGIHGIRLELVPDEEHESKGTYNGEITSDLKEPCPYCGSVDCEFSCDGSQGAQSDEDGETEQEAIERHKFNAGIDALESIILAHACAGINITSLAYKEGIEVTLNALSDRHS